MPIQRGALILSDDILFRVQPFPIDHDIATTLRQISSPNRRRFKALSHGSQPATDLGRFEANKIELYEEGQNLLTPASWGVCLQASSFSHSCMPNAFLSYNSYEDKVKVYAIDNIDQDAEILVNWQGIAPLDPVESRQADVQLLYGSPCQCRGCERVGEIQTARARASKKNRRELRQIRDDVIWCHQRDANSAQRWKKSERIVSRTGITHNRALEEGIPCPFMAEVYHFVAEYWHIRYEAACASLPEADRAQGHAWKQNAIFCARLAQEVYVEATGETSIRSMELQGLVDRLQTLPV